jgi:hypothetical protein
MACYYHPTCYYYSSNISYTQVNTRTHTQPGIRGAHRLAGTTGGHTTQNYNRSSKCIESEAYGITIFIGLNGPRASRARPSSPHSCGIPNRDIQLLMDDLSSNTHLQLLHMYHT